MPIKPVTVPGSCDKPEYECKNCGDTIPDNMYDFCPWCGQAIDWSDEFGVVRRTADGFKQEADWMEELKRYRDLEEQGRLLVLPCKVGNKQLKGEKKNDY